MTHRDAQTTAGSLKKTLAKKLLNAGHAQQQFEQPKKYIDDETNCGRDIELKKWFHRKFQSKAEATPTEPNKQKKNNFIKKQTHREIIVNKMLETCINFEPGPMEIEELALFDIDRAVWILGESYNSLKDRTEIKRAISSFLWFTYRKNFAAIGGTGPTSDQGWGCMLRCGQMLLAQALVRRHLGTWWRWNPKDKRDEQYLAILSMFQDKKSQTYSLHQIAQMGVSEGKLIGEWFGPNTVAHVLKKLTVYDDWSTLTVHVAMDNVVVLEHIREVCQTPPKRNGNADPCCSSRNGSSSAELTQETSLIEDNVQSPVWRPLLLIIPLRLGLSNLNSVYIPALKEFFLLKQCLGAIGGRPNHALYFIGSVGDELIYLDPHYCQSSIDLDAELSKMPKNNLDVPDSSFHCPYILHMPVANIDPSLALAFYCHTEAELDDLCNCFRKSLLKASNPPLFELLDRPPTSWPKFVPYSGEETASSHDFAVVEPHFDSEEEFEIVG